MNELTLGDVTVTRIEEMHGPIMLIVRPRHRI